MTRRAEKYGHHGFAFYLKVLNDAEEYPGVRISAAQAIGYWGNKAHNILPLLEEMNHKKIPVDVRDAIVDTIKEITIGIATNGTTTGNDYPSLKFPDAKTAQKFNDIINGIYDLFGHPNSQRKALDLFDKIKIDDRRMAAAVIPFLLAVQEGNGDHTQDIKTKVGEIANTLARNVGIALPPVHHPKTDLSLPEPYDHDASYSSIYLHKPIDIALFAKNPDYRINAVNLLARFAGENSDLAKSFIAKVATGDENPEVKEQAKKTFSTLIGERENLDDELNHFNKEAELLIPKGTHAPNPYIYGASLLKLLKEEAIEDKTEFLRYAILAAERKNALAISAIKLVKRALREELGLKEQFGWEQTFRVMATKSAPNQDSPIDADAILKEFLTHLSLPGFDPKSSTKSRSRPIIEKLHADNERQKYEAATITGTALQVARWVVMFRALTEIQAWQYPSVEEISFKGSHLIQFAHPIDGKMRESLNTNGSHNNFSFLFNGKPMFNNEDFLMHVLHGIKLLSEETTLLTALHEEDYARYRITGSHKPNYIDVTYGKNDRSLRVVNVGSREPHKKRAEDRTPSSSANPYYAILKILVGAYLGLNENVNMPISDKKRELKISEAKYGYLKDKPSPQFLWEIFANLFTTAKRPATPNLSPHRIPQDIESAMREFEKGKLFRQTLNALGAKYGNDPLIGDKLHEEVLLCAESGRTSPGARR